MHWSLALVGLFILTRFLGQGGVLDKLDRAATDIQFHSNPAPYDTPVVIVTIDDADYQQMFHGSSPLNADQLFDLVNDIAKGGPSVIGVDIDTFSPAFGPATIPLQCNCSVVWEQEVNQSPALVGSGEKLTLADPPAALVAPGVENTSYGIPILIDDPEDGATRRYQRFFATDSTLIPSFPSAVAIAYSKKTGRPLIPALTSPSQDEYLIRFSGDREGTHRIRLSATKLQELAKNWTGGASPIKGRIVLLGGNYLGQDLHWTPLGQMNGVEVLANVIETELNGGGSRAPGPNALSLLEVIMAFVIVLFLYFVPLSRGWLPGLALVLVLALIGSWIAYRDWSHVGHFIFIVFGMLLFERLEHYVKHEFPHFISRGTDEHGK